MVLSDAAQRARLPNPVGPPDTPAATSSARAPAHRAAPVRRTSLLPAVDYADQPSVIKSIRYLVQPRRSRRTPHDGPAQPATEHLPRRRRTRLISRLTARPAPGGLSALADHVPPGTRRRGPTTAAAERQLTRCGPARRRTTCRRWPRTTARRPGQSPHQTRSGRRRASAASPRVHAAVASAPRPPVATSAVARSCGEELVRAREWERRLGVGVSPLEEVADPDGSASALCCPR